LLRDEAKVGAEDPYHDMYWTDVIGTHAIKLVREFHAKGTPFFLNVWWLTPHTPYEPAPEPHWSQTAASGISEDQHRFRSMVARMDYQVGRILGTLDELGIADNTLVLFVSDNGGAYEANIGPLKGGKTDLHEGGIRVPFIARWPDRIKPGRQSSVLGHTNDLLPTCCAAAGAEPLAKGQCDGLNLLPLLTGHTDRLDRGAVFWQIRLYKHLQRHYPKPQPYASEVARRGRWKLLALNGIPVELVDLEADLGEQTDLLEARPDIVKSLHSELTAWLAESRQPFGTVD
jgi:N-acetylgalactosamine-6-sulfatase